MQFAEYVKEIWLLLSKHVHLQDALSARTESLSFLLQLLKHFFFGCIIKLKTCKLNYHIFYLIFRRVDLKEWLNIIMFLFKLLNTVSHQNISSKHTYRIPAPAPTFVSLITNLFTSQRSTSETSMKFGVWKFSIDMSRGYPSALIISVKSDKQARAGIPSYISNMDITKNSGSHSTLFIYR